MLLAGSFVFYAWGDTISLPLVVLSAFINYELGSLIAHCKERGVMRRVWLFAAVAFHIGIFAMLKLTGMLEILPLGLSFYTFQAVSYAVDVYRGTIRAERSLIRYCTYFFMFPKFISGPITRYGEVRQSLEKRKLSLLQIEDGLKLFVLGLGSKVLVADQMGKLWNAIQTVGFASISMPLAWFGAIAVSLQIYFDFQGYSLMAVGLGQMLGFKLPRNFNYPYASGSMTEFWRNWHITLSLWFRDYVYIPLGGSRKGMFRTICNLLVVWVLTGLWHGTTVNFLVWGIGFFVILSLEKLFLKKVLDETILLKRVYMLLLIPLSWIVFSIPDLGELVIYLRRMFDFMSLYDTQSLWDVVYYAKDYAWMAAVGIIFSTPVFAKLYEARKKNIVTLLILLAMFWLSVYQIVSADSNPFLYANF